MIETLFGISGAVQDGVTTEFSHRMRVACGVADPTAERD